MQVVLDMPQLFCQIKRAGQKIVAELIKNKEWCR